LAARRGSSPRNDPDTVEIAGYTDRLGYVGGQAVRLFVHTTAPQFDVLVIRDGLDPRPVWSKTALPGMV
jgi:hypothetical protein